jgi:dihydropyrimidine dehydrogenase (NAD+) subunit PreA
MPDLRINFAGIRSPNPFWLASAQPTNSAAQDHRAFEAGWGGAVWKRNRFSMPIDYEAIRL